MHVINARFPFRRKLPLLGKIRILRMLEKCYIMLWRLGLSCYGRLSTLAGIIFWQPRRSVMDGQWLPLINFPSMAENRCCHVELENITISQVFHSYLNKEEVCGHSHDASKWTTKAVIVYNDARANALY